MFDWSSAPSAPNDGVEATTTPTEAEKTAGSGDQVPGRGLYTEEARQRRLDFISEKRRTALKATSHIHLDPDRLRGNIENLIGSVEIPVGLAGPLHFHGSTVEGLIYLPLATTEGALVASATRGARAISRSGGITTRVIHQRMTRSPMFEFHTLSEAATFVTWLASQEERIRAEAAKGSRHGKLIQIEPSLMGPMVHIAFVYETGDAAGQNMTTMCTMHACKWIQEEIKRLPVHLEQFFIEGNLTGDKKVTLASFIKGRGTRVTAEAFVDNDTLRHILKVKPEDVMRGVRCGIAGGFQSGQIGFTINAANVVAAAFTACGQDIACVHESSLATLDVRAEPDGLRFSLLMPCLVVGTVGGGTHLPRQREMLELIGCTGPGSSSRLAEIIAGFALALDMSTMSAIGSGQFASAHERLGRNRPVQGLGLSDLTPAFFQRILQDTLGEPSTTVSEIEPVFDLKMGSSIITAVAAQQLSNKLIGHFPLRLTLSRHGDRQIVDVIAKVKPTDEEVIQVSAKVARMCGLDVGEQYAKVKEQLGFKGCHQRELAIYRQRDPRFTAHVPRIFGLYEEPSREAYVVLMERLLDMDLMDTACDPSGWRREHIEAVIKGIAQIHAIWYGREAELKRIPWLDEPQNTARMVELSPLWRALSVHALHEFPEWYDPTYHRFNQELIDTIPHWHPELDRMKKTLIHNDFNLRNVALRKTGAGLLACIYDWELASVHVPQHDLAEFLAFVLPPDVGASEVEHYVELHRRVLAQSACVILPREDWTRGYLLSLKDLVVNRQALYFLAHSLSECGFFPRIALTLRRLHELAERAKQGAGAEPRYPLA